MRHLLVVIISVLIAIGLSLAVDWGSFHMPSFKDDPSSTEYNKFEDYSERLWIDTIMYAKGHAFGYSGDVSMWDGWYFDSIPIGNDIMLTCDSIGPSLLTLSLVTRQETIDMGDSDAPEKIREFMQPITGFKRFHKNYEEILDSFTDEYGTFTCTGYFSSCIDYADSCTLNSDLINRFICSLSDISKAEALKLSSMYALYAGFNTAKNYRPVYTGNYGNIQKLSDFLAHKTFENWKRGGDINERDNGATIEIHSHIINSNFVTVSRFEYERIGIGHGGFTETFHSMDLSDGKTLTNEDIFRPNTSNEVKKLLFEVMVKDKHYLEWNDRLVDANQIEQLIEAWQSLGIHRSGNDSENSNTDSVFELPDVALAENGVIFSFQPCEIECWAAGAFHFIVSYDDLVPYLTKRAKRLLSVLDQPRH